MDTCPQEACRSKKGGEGKRGKLTEAVDHGGWFCPKRRSLALKRGRNPTEGGREEPRWWQESIGKGGTQNGVSPREGELTEKRTVLISWRDEKSLSGMGEGAPNEGIRWWVKRDGRALS